MALVIPDEFLRTAHISKAELKLEIARRIQKFVDTVNSFYEGDIV